VIQDEVAETLPDVVNLGIKITEAEAAYKQAETSSDKRKAKERKEDLLRLKRVEQIYVRICIVGNLISDLTLLQSAILPSLPGWVTILLKLLLATVSAGSNSQQPQSANGFPPGVPSRAYYTFA
jgi:hypothetical protein